MARPSKIWPRKGRGFWTTINKEQIPLGHDRKEAERQFARLLLTRETGRRHNHSVVFLVDKYLDARQPEIRPETYTLYRSWLQRFIDEYGRMRASELKPLHVTAWLKAHPEWNSSTKNTAVAVLKAWSKWCDREEWLEVDPLRNAKKPRAKKRKPADRAELARLEEAITDPDFKDFFVFLVETGCRPGEARTLTASRIDWKRSTAVVMGKTGERLVALSKRALGILQRLRVIHPTGALLRPIGNDEWDDGRRYRAFEKWKAIAGVSDEIVPYHARHDLAGRWVEKGIDGMKASKQLGHSSANMTISTYLHLSDAALVAAADLGSHESSASQAHRKNPAAARSRPKGRKAKSGKASRVKRPRLRAGKTE